ncbi:MAG: penicillin-binding transpeptidase domain-containing protein [Chloroflexota bacterium]
MPPRPDDAAIAFLGAWQHGQYSAMYDMLSTAAQAATPRDVFVRRYTNIHDGIGETKLTAEPAGPPSAADPLVTRVPFQVTRSLAVFGDITELNALPLVLEDNLWKVEWQPSLIFTSLTAASTIRVTPDVPVRGRILDRSGKSLADNGSILVVGVVPGDVKDEPALVQSLAVALDLTPEAIKQRMQGGQPNWFMPVAERSEADRDDLSQSIGSIAGVSLQDRPARVYPLGQAAAHLIGYVGHPTADELRTLSSVGYDESDWIGRAGIEAWGEHLLAGTRGGSIQIVDHSGRVLRNVAHTAAEPGQDVKLNLDGVIQMAAATALGDKTGSVVVLDPRDNSLLALVSEPSFDPNQLVIGLSDSEWQQLNGAQHPLLLRAAESAYPTGSIFKVITMAAGLEQGGFKPSNTFDCGLDWNGLSGVTLHNWQAQGTLSLTQALTESCNPAFYAIGLKLDTLDPTILPTEARTFGLGQPTRATGIHEVPGTLPDPDWKRMQLGEPWTSGDSVNLAIGQGYLLATPLQMANAYAALARGGELLAPHVTADEPRQTLRSLNLRPGTRAAILDGMQRVTSTPQGTANYAFRDERLPIAAKTGSAENENPDAHAWFVGFTPPEAASLLVLVMVEGGQHGGTVAAPVGREIIDVAYPLTR